jgi:hypothetical protein
MKTIRIYNEDLEYTFTHEVVDDNSIVYQLYEDKKFIHRIEDNGNNFILNGKELDYHEFADLFIFFKCIHEVDKKMIGELDAVTEQLIFKI